MRSGNIGLKTHWPLIIGGDNVVLSASLRQSACRVACGTDHPCYVGTDRRTAIRMAYSGTHLIKAIASIYVKRLKDCQLEQKHAVSAGTAPERLGSSPLPSQGSISPTRPAGLRKKRLAIVLFDHRLIRVNIRTQSI